MTKDDKNHACKRVLFFIAFSLILTNCSHYHSLHIWGITGNAYFFDHIVILDYTNKLFRIK